MKQKRILLADELRGLAVLLMVWYHAMYNLVFIFGIRWQGFSSPWMKGIQLFIACTFIFLAGVMCNYSHSNLRRGAVTFGIALCITLLTFTVLPSQRIVFGILHLLGICMLCAALLLPHLRRLAPLPGMLCCLLLFAFTYTIGRGYVGIGPLQIALPPSWYDAVFLFPLGLPPRFFFSADYYPLLPWCFLFFCGCFFGIAAAQHPLPDFVYRSHAAPLAAIGRRALLIYVLHQPLLYGIMLAVFKILQ